MTQPTRVLVVTFAWPPTLMTSVLRPLSALERHGEIQLRVTDPRLGKLTDRDLQWCDVAVFCRSQSAVDLGAALRACDLGKRIIYEIDDDFFTIPLGTQIGQHHRSADNLFRAATFFQIASVVRTFSPLLHERANDIGDNAVLLRSYFASDLVDVERRVPDERVHLAYATARLDGPDFLFFQLAMERVVKTFGDAIRVHVWREPSRALLDAGNVIVHSPVNSYDSFVSSFASLSPDIGLAPIPDHPFYRAKTDNKYREYGGSSCAGIYSAIEPYTHVVHDRVNGMLAPNDPDAWFDAIETLVSNAQLRSTIVSNALEDVSTRYTFDNALDDWRSNITAAIDAPPRPALKKPLEPAARNISVVQNPETLTASGQTSFESDRRLFDTAFAFHSHGIGVFTTTLAAVGEGIMSIDAPCVLFYPHTSEEAETAVTLAPRFRSTIIDLGMLCPADLDAVTELAAGSADIHWVFEGVGSTAGRVTSIPSDASLTSSRFSLEGRVGAYMSLLAGIYGIEREPRSPTQSRMITVLQRAERFMGTQAKKVRYGARLALWRAGSRRL